MTATGGQGNFHGGAQGRAWLIAALVVGLTLPGCSIRPEALAPVTEPVYPVDRVVLDDVSVLAVYDPFEGLNRSLYRFNARVDDYLLNPAVNAYHFVVPRPLRAGIRNFFINLGGLRVLVNEILQVRPRAAVETTGRLLVNTTIGIGGLLDPATALGIPLHDEDFGQTLGRYGVPRGPYLVLPVLGPSTLRDAPGRAVDALNMTIVDPLGLRESKERRWVYYPVSILDTRSNTEFQYYETGSPFEYELVRLLFVTQRQLEIEK
jgi:phospholipid-binding lipoprotein MlaA